jgi:glycosyltransferase involved in cell wall biosynthesis
MQVLTELYKEGLILEKQEVNLFPIYGGRSPLINIVRYFLASLVMLFLSLNLVRKIGKFHLCIAMGWDQSLQALLLKKFSLVKKLVYWSNDWFVPEKKSSLLFYLDKNGLWPFLDERMALSCDALWNVTKRIRDARHSRLRNFRHRKEAIVMPPIKIKHSNTTAVRSNRIGFVGGVRPGQGLELAIKALYHLKKMGIDATLEIVGPGLKSYRSYLRNLAEKLGVLYQVKFLGFVKTEELRRVSMRWRCAIALYETAERIMVYYSYGGKLLFYLECSIPIVACRCTELLEELKRNKAALIAKNDPEDVSRLLAKILSDDGLYHEMVKSTKYFLSLKTNVMWHEIDELFGNV